MKKQFSRRPRYETARDRQEERVIIEQFTDLPAYKVPERYPFDFAIVEDDHIVAAVEVKSRKINLETMGSLHISAAKLVNLSDYNSKLNLDCYLLVRAKDGLFSFEVTETALQSLSGTLIIGGRKDRRDPQDMEPCLVVPFDRFRRLA